MNKGLSFISDALEKSRIDKSVIMVINKDVLIVEYSLDIYANKIIIFSHSVILIHMLVKMEYFNLIWVKAVIMEDNQVVKNVKFYLDGIVLVD